MRTWDVFYPYVLPEVMGCPEPTVDLHLRNAARKFCEQTRAWREDLPPVTTREGRDDYSLLYPAQSEGVELIGVTFNGQDGGLEVIDGTSAGERRRNSGGQRRILTQDMIDFRVMPSQAAGVPIIVTAVLQPTEAATAMPDAIADSYKTEIAGGALATLLAMNQATWQNLSLAGIKDAQFRADLARIKSRVWKAFTNRRPRVRAQFF